MNGPHLFLDSSFWIALRDEKETEHKRAAEITAHLLNRKERLVVTPLVFAETHAYFAKAPYRAQQILDDFENNPILVCEQPTPLDQREAIRLLRRHTDKTYSFCDAVSFIIMQRLELKRAATFDDHFRQFGKFEVIP